MPLPVLMALWCFMRAFPKADFDSFVAHYNRAVALVAREQAREGHAQ